MNELFTRIAPAYDRANDWLSVWVHRLWKKKLIEQPLLPKGARVLDGACGTGDVAILLQQRYGNTLEVWGVDICEPMMEQGRRKAQKGGWPIHWQQAPLEALPWPDHTWDAIYISFGLRNTQDPDQVLQECWRTLKPGGWLRILEFGRPQGPQWWVKLYGIYHRHGLPRLGGWITQQPEAYRYLEQSSGAFPCGDAFWHAFKSTQRFDPRNWEALWGGICYLYTLVKPPR